MCVVRMSRIYSRLILIESLRCKRPVRGRVPVQEVTDAVLRAKRIQSWRVAKRNGLVTTMRGTARNSLLRRRASDPLEVLLLAATL